MSGARDIRSFFTSNGPSPKRRRTAAGAVATAAETDAAEISTKATDAEQSEAAVEAAAESTDASADAPASAEGAAKPEKELVKEPLPHKFSNLHHNVPILMHESWHAQLADEFKRPYFKSLVQFLTTEENKKKTLYPSPENVFAALRDCAFDSLKVVILGQDPYHGPNQAHGLSFSVLPGIQPPPSLVNIYKEAMSDVGISKPTHGCLSCWSKQGVLMLNTVLTVRRGEPNSHKGQGWEKLTDAVIMRINKHAENVVFLLWGKPAQTKGAIINSSKHLIIKSSHPSPLGATKTNEPFIGSKCFSRANAYLEKHGKDPIDWRVL
ncbi:hypothetical protein PINS_up007706 [Pythium insidiosum]|nr:hypothetical protein PINS_up007706 [Pythium insidiosum]